MKKLILQLFTVTVFVIILIGCEQTREFLDIPTQGDLRGTIRDSLSGQPISGALITADFILPNSSVGEPRTASFETTMNGTYLLKGIWDEAFVRVEKPGFESVAFSISMSKEIRENDFNITMKGLPVVYGEFIENLGLNYTTNDSSKVVLEIRDLYNDNADEEFIANLFFYSLESDLNVLALQMFIVFRSQTFGTMNTTLSAQMFPEAEPGTVQEYSYYYEISDPDGNLIDYGLQGEETLDTVRIIH